MKHVARVAFVAVVIVATAGGYLLYQAIAAASHAEHALHAALLTLRLLEDHVARTDGKWPGSWADLESLPPRRWAMFQWPEDSHEVQQYVEVDFSVDPQSLVKQDADPFDAVRQIEPYYTYKNRGYVEALLETIREHAPAETRSQGSP